MHVPSLDHDHRSAICPIAMGSSLRKHRGRTGFWSIPITTRPIVGRYYDALPPSLSGTFKICHNTDIWPNGLLEPRTVVANSYLFSGSRTASATVSYALPILRNASRCIRPDIVGEAINPRRGEARTSRDERNISN